MINDYFFENSIIFESMSVSAVVAFACSKRKYRSYFKQIHMFYKFSKYSIKQTGKGELKEHHILKSLIGKFEAFQNPVHDLY